jgi:formylglycine-generating enzyme required for sulfatase activity
MGLRNLTLADWARMSDATAKAECEALARALPHGLQLDELAAHAYCGRKHRVARFSRREPDGVAHLVLVPGGEATLGFDGQEFMPTPQQMDSFADSAEALGIGQSIGEHVDAYTSARRTIDVAPLLVEIEARNVGVEPVGADDPVLAELRAGLKGSARVEYSDGYIVDRRGAWYRRPTSAADLQAALAADGLRLLTSDEWEHACGAGTSTLFRWGDDCPADFYPTDTSAKDRRQSTAWVLSGAGF